MTENRLRSRPAVGSGSSEEVSWQDDEPHQEDGIARLEWNAGQTPCASFRSTDLEVAGFVWPLGLNSIPSMAGRTCLISDGCPGSCPDVVVWYPHPGMRSLFGPLDCLDSRMWNFGKRSAGRRQRCLAAMPRIW